MQYNSFFRHGSLIGWLAIIAPASLNSTLSYVPSTSAASNCRVCGRQFGISLRRHHCRLCGNLFCNDCSSFYCQLANNKAPVRTCQSCFDVLERLKTLHTEDVELNLTDGDDVSTRLRHGSQALPTAPGVLEAVPSNPVTKSSRLMPPSPTLVGSTRSFPDTTTPTTPPAPRHKMGSSPLAITSINRMSSTPTLTEEGSPG